MAEHLPKLIAEELTCHICTEIYRNPVQLPCQHSFCRECLTAYAHCDKRTLIDKEVTKEKLKAEASGVPEQPLTTGVEGFLCPVCRTPTDLGADDVSKLPVHFTIANIVGKYQSDVERDSSEPKCSLCEGDQPEAATKGCLACKCLYCQECLSAFHPMRGPFSKHALVEAAHFAAIPMCEEHDEPLKVFCGDCKHLYCTTCSVIYHGEHPLRTTDVAFDEEKVRLIENTKMLEGLQHGMERCLTEFSEVRENVKNFLDGQTDVIEDKYQDALKILEKWRSERLEKINTKRECLYSQTDEEINHVKTQLEELVDCLGAAKDLGNIMDKIQYLLKSDETIGRMKQVSQPSDVVVQTFKTNKMKIEEGMDNEEDLSETIYCVLMKHDKSLEYRIPHHTIQCSEFAMKELMHDCVSVRDNGKVLVNLRQCAQEGCLDVAMADNCFQDGSVYWEIDISYTVKTKRRLMYSAGVLKQSKPPPTRLGEDEHSWGVDITGSPLKFNCRNGGSVAYSCPVYPANETGNHGTVRQGFYLDRVARTLTVLDCTHDRILHTFLDVDLSEPLTPAVAVYNFNHLNVSAVLKTGRDISSLPICLHAFLHNRQTISAQSLQHGVLKW